MVSAGANIHTLEVLGGTLMGKSGQVSVTSQLVKVVGSNVQKLQNLSLKAASFDLTCGTSCQLITANVAFDTTTQVKAKF